MRPPEKRRHCLFSYSYSPQKNVPMFINRGHILKQLYMQNRRQCDWFEIEDYTSTVKQGCVLAARIAG